MAVCTKDLLHPALLLLTVAAGESSEAQLSFVADLEFVGADSGFLQWGRGTSGRCFNFTLRGAMSRKFYPIARLRICLHFVLLAYKIVSQHWSFGIGGGLRRP